MVNGENKLEIILDSLRVILERDPQRGVDKVKDLLKSANESDAENLFKLIQEDQRTLELYLKGLKQNEFVRKCSWHSQYNNGEEATIVNGINIPIPVPTGYFDDVSGKINYGLCRECHSKILKTEGLEWLKWNARNAYITGKAGLMNLRLALDVKID